MQRCYVNTAITILINILRICVFWLRRVQAGAHLVGNEPTGMKPFRRSVIMLKVRKKTTFVLLLTVVSKGSDTPRRTKALVES